VTAYAEVHIEVNDLHFAMSIGAGEGATLDEDDIYALSDWVQRTVSTVIEQHQEDE
jgi:hypothetical protein